MGCLRVIFLWSSHVVGFAAKSAISSLSMFFLMGVVLSCYTVWVYTALQLVLSIADLSRCEFYFLCFGSVFFGFIVNRLYV